MSAWLPTLVAAALYVAAAVLLLRRVGPGGDAERPDPGALVLALVLPAVALHAIAHWLDARALGGWNPSFGAALSLVALGMALLTALASRAPRLDALGIVVFPLAAALLLAFHFLGHGRPTALGWRLLLHAWLALVAYATLALAALLAVMLWLQERGLRHRSTPGWLGALPPLTQLETLLFRSLGVAFALLSAALLTGVLFVEDMLAQHLWHKTVLSALSWAVLALLLFGRWRWGWRGPRAVRFTLTAMALLLLAYFGSKYVLGALQRL
jgi:ABC-type uncharacterized transport system permease subunit